MGLALEEVGREEKERRVEEKSAPGRMGDGFSERDWVVWWW